MGKKLIETLLSPLDNRYFVFGIIGIVIGIYLINDYMKFHQYRRNIDRITDDEMEDFLLEIAENLDYSSLLNENRFDQGETLIPSEYGKANYIDKEVIQYYWERIGYLEKRRKHGYCYMYYGANVHYVDQLNIKIYILKSNDSRYKYLIEIEPLIFSIEPDFKNPGSAWTLFGIPGQVVIWNGSNFELIEEVGKGENEHVYLEQDFTTCYLIEMKLYYGRQKGSLDGYGFHLFQYVVLDQDGNLLMIYVQRIEWVS